MKNLHLLSLKMVKVLKLGLVNYDTAHKIQSALARKQFEARRMGLDVNYDTILLIEHKPVYTVGVRDSTQKDIIEQLQSLGAEFKKTDRGGLITFHGPGQLVAYPVLNLKNFKTSVRWYVKSLEETIINMCHDLGIIASRSQHTGVWVNDNKIAAIGIHASRYVTTHGVAINCNNDLTWFDHIDPCGIDDKGVTSITKEMGQEYSVEKITPYFLKNFQNVFNCEIEDFELNAPDELVKSVHNFLGDDNKVSDSQSMDNEKQKADKN